jgi:sulfur-oxidizing protein SoxY
MNGKFLLFALCLAFWVVPVRAADDASNPDTEIWRKVRADLFGKRVIEDDGAAGYIRMQIPARAADAAVVPLAIRAGGAPGEPTTKKLYVIIDRNPSPIAAIFEFGEGSASASVETRVRIEEYTWIRIIAERTDGGLIGTQRFVKAAGGCSAPAGKTLAERLAGMGQIKWRIDPAAENWPATVQLMIRHPNNSGLAMDQLTRLYDPPHYVRSVRVTRQDALVFSADVDFSISENPSFRFSVKPGFDNDLHVVVTDSNELTFEGRSSVLR